MLGAQEDPAYDSTFRVFASDRDDMEAAHQWLTDMHAAYPGERIVIIGFSYGAAAGLVVANWLAADNITVDYLVTIDTVTGLRGGDNYPTVTEGWYSHEEGTRWTGKPRNVTNALNLYAPTRDPFLFNRIQTVVGADNVAVTEYTLYCCGLAFTFPVNHQNIMNENNWGGPWLGMPWNNYFTNVKMNHVTAGTVSGWFSATPRFRSGPR
jgi:hypothetical protein